MCGRAVPCSPLGARLHRISPQRSDPSRFLPLCHPVRPLTVPAAILKNISTSPSPCPHPLLSCPIHTPPQPPCTQLNKRQDRESVLVKRRKCVQFKKGAGSTTLESCSCLPSSANMEAFAKDYFIHSEVQIYIGYVKNNTDDKNEI